MKAVILKTRLRSLRTLSSSILIPEKLLLLLLVQCSSSILNTLSLELGGNEKGFRLSMMSSYKQTAPTSALLLPLIFLAFCSFFFNLQKRNRSLF